jgi:hypothetical protein
MGIKRKRVWYWGALIAALAGCNAEPALVASNCDKAEGCVSREALKIDAVDILLVIDDSPSTAFASARLKEELPRMLNVITSGDSDDVEFPPAKSVHIAVTTTDMGAGDGTNLAGCTAWGRDGTFVKPTEFGVTCDVDYPGFLAFEGGPAPIATVDTVSCVPLVTPQQTSGTQGFGCGFEQPLEASLKALLPENSAVTFVHGEAHGDRENAGFLRDNSLLVVVVVTDEDDCSTEDYAIFDPLSDSNRMSGVNLACHNNRDKLFDVKRYVDNLNDLRPNNDNVIFAVIAGVPAELTNDDEFRGAYDLSTDAGARAYYDAILADDRMTDRVAGNEPTQSIAPSCVVVSGQDTSVAARATPPRRLIEVAKRFGARSVVGSLCADDFGSTTGSLVRAIGEQLAAASGD